MAAWCDTSDTATRLWMSIHETKNVYSQVRTVRCAPGTCQAHVVRVPLLLAVCRNYRARITAHYSTTTSSAYMKH